MTADESLGDLRTPSVERSISGTAEVTLGGVTSKIGYKIRELAEGLTEVVVHIGESVGNAVRAIVRHQVLAVAGVSMGIAAAPRAQSESRGALMNDGVTRAQMTAVNPSLEGFYANGTSFVDGEQAPYNATLTHLWGPYYGAAAHEVRDGLSIGEIFPGRDYINNPGAPISISRVDISPYSDFAIITTATEDNTPRDPNSRLVGLVVARVGGQITNSGSTVYTYFAAPQNLAFINQVTGSTFTQEQIHSGQSIIADPSDGVNVWSSGYGAWGTPTTGLSNPDGLPGQWQGKFILNGGGLGGAWSDPNLYFATAFRNDNGLMCGPLNGLGESIDSGSVGIIVVPEPGSAGLLISGFAGALALRRRSKGTR